MHRTPLRALALAAACVGVAALPAVASAKITIASDPDHPVAGDTLDLNGKLTGARHGNKALRLFEKKAGTGRYVQVARTKTKASGKYAFDVTDVDTNATWQVRSRGHGKSPKLLVPVALDANWSVAPADGSNQTIGAPITLGVTVTTKTGQGVPGVEVDWLNRDRRDAEVTDPLTSATTDANGNATTTVTFPGEPRPVNVIAKTVATKTNAAGRTALASSFQLQEPQVPGFPIQVSADPVTAGQLLTIATHTAPGQTITLLKHHEPAGSEAFAPFTSGPTDSSGNFSFPASFTENQTIFATNGSSNSARLAIGVKDVITGSVNTTTAPAGSTITLSGKVVPAHPGQHALLLEQTGTNPANGTPILHIRKEVAIGEDGSFETPFEVGHAGTRTFFFALNGGAENQGSIAALPTITVTPPA